MTYELTEEQHERLYDFYLRMKENYFLVSEEERMRQRIEMLNIASKRNKL